MSKRNFHKEAIDILAWPDIKPSDMLREIAKQQPSVFVKVAYALGYKPAGTLQSRALELMKGGCKVDAIRLVRNETNMGLAEAKEYVERLAA